MWPWRGGVGVDLFGREMLGDTVRHIFGVFRPGNETALKCTTVPLRLSRSCGTPLPSEDSIPQAARKAPAGATEEDRGQADARVEAPFARAPLLNFRKVRGAGARVADSQSDDSPTALLRLQRQSLYKRFNDFEVGVLTFASLSCGVDSSKAGFSRID